jgi:hypothetical protein
VNPKTWLSLVHSPRDTGSVRHFGSKASDTTWRPSLTLFDLLSPRGPYLYLSHDNYAPVQGRRSSALCVFSLPMIASLALRPAHFFPLLFVMAKDQEKPSVSNDVVSVRNESGWKCPPRR